MLIVCPHCEARYEVETARFGTAPRTVRCSACNFEWLHLPAPGDTGTAREAAAADLHFPAAMALAQQGIAEAAAEEERAAGEPGADDVATPPPLPAADVAGNAAASPVPVPAAASSGAKAAAEAAAEPAGAAAVTAAAEAQAATDDFEIELGNATTPAVEAPPPRLPRWAVIVSGAVAGLAVLALVLLLGRGAVQEAVPATAGLYRLLGLTDEAVGAGLAIRDVASSREWTEGADVLIVSGQVTNTTGGPLAVPPLKVALHDEANQPLQAVTVAAAGKVLMAGESTQFRARIDQPQEAARRIVITFDSGGQ